MKLFILPYKSASKSAKLLASALNCKRIKLRGSRFRHTNNKLVINWGSSNPHPRVGLGSMLNLPEHVQLAANKLNTFSVLDTAGVSTVPWTTSKAQANEWLDHACTVYERHSLTGNSGSGIRIVSGELMELQDAQLYTRGVSRKAEYRVHVGLSSTDEPIMLHLQQKRLRRPPPEDRIEGIRNCANGWIFACNDIEPLSEEQLQVAIDAVKALGLDFGAVDLLIGKRDNKAYVLEVNTAPGIEGTTLEKYVNYFEVMRNAI